MHLSRLAVSTSALAILCSTTASFAQQAEPAKPQNNKIFELGRLVLYGKADDNVSIGGQSVSQSVVTPDDVRKQNRNTLDDALKTVPGVAVSNSGTGARNEQLIYVRGFDRYQVPLYIDGVRVYLPADNRIDYGRFLTPDLSEIQIQKGYVSVLSGPGGLGGAINLVTRKPSKPFEAELQTGIDLGNTGKMSAFTTYGSVGTRQDLFYLQASGSFRDSDGWFLPRGYDPVLVNGAMIEDGGRRNLSDVQDMRLNFKAGLTPNATDEYVLSYTYQKGEKNAPYSVLEPVRTPTSPATPPTGAYQRDWTWPKWNIGSLAFNSHTAIGESSYVRTKAYYNTFDNILSAYDDSSFTTQSAGRSFISTYDDHSYGFSIEGGTELIPMNTLKVAAHYRRDVHKERDLNRPTSPLVNLEPWQTRLEETWSFAAENTFHVNSKLDLVGGVSYDLSKAKRAENFASPPGTPTPPPVMMYLPLGDRDAINWQAAALWRPIEGHELHASISNRTRFATFFERYSCRFGTAQPNPYLNPERATNLELGWNGQLNPTLSAGSNLFYSDVKDMIQSVPAVAPALPQNQNIGDGVYYGAELFAEWEALPSLTIGGRYTWLHREIKDPIRPGLKPLNTPEHSLFAYADWQATDKLTISPNIEYYSARWSSNRAEDAYFKTSGYALFNVNAEYKFNDTLGANFGVRNILDKEYSTAYGFPEAGRTIYLKTRLTF